MLISVVCGTHIAASACERSTTSPARLCKHSAIYSAEIRSHACFTPSSTYILSTTLSSTLRIHNIHTSKVLRTFRHGSYISEKYPCPSVVFAKPQPLSEPSTQPQTRATGQYENAWVVAGSENGHVVIWDVATKAIVADLSGPTRPVIALAVSGRIQTTLFNY